MARNTNVKKGLQGFQRTTKGATAPTSGSPTPALQTNTTPHSSGDGRYADAYSAYESRTATTWYRAYDSKNRSLGLFQNHQQAHMKAMAAGGFVREYDKKPDDEGIVSRLTGDGRSLAPTDGGSFDLPELSAFDRPKRKYTVVDSKGKSRGSFTEKHEAQQKATEVGGKVDTYVLKDAYQYARPKENMGFWERLRDNGKPYRKAK